MPAGVRPELTLASAKGKEMRSLLQFYYVLGGDCQQ
jgi:hypothetical protein